MTFLQGGPGHGERGEKGIIFQRIKYSELRNCCSGLGKDRTKKNSNKTFKFIKITASPLDKWNIDIETSIFSSITMHVDLLLCHCLAKKRLTLHSRSRTYRPTHSLRTSFPFTVNTHSLRCLGNSIFSKAQGTRLTDVHCCSVTSLEEISNFRLCTVNGVKQQGRLCTGIFLTLQGKRWEDG